MSWTSQHKPLQKHIPEPAPAYSSIAAIDLQTSPGEEYENASSRRVVERLETAFAAARTNTRHIDYTVYTTPHPGSPPTEHPEMILPSRSAKKQSRIIRYLLLTQNATKTCSLNQSAAKLKIHPYLILQNLRLVSGWPGQGAVQNHIPGTPAPGNTGINNKTPTKGDCVVGRTSIKHAAPHASLFSPANRGHTRGEKSKKRRYSPALPRARAWRRSRTRRHPIPPP